VFFVLFFQAIKKWQSKDPTKKQLDQTSVSTILPMSYLLIAIENCRLMHDKKRQAKQKKNMP